jgi:parvulin-like peptidyl-prolyl isomerase
MKRLLIAAMAASALSLAAQTTIDKPAATIKLTKQEVISVRQFKADVEKIEAAIGQKLPDDKRRELLDNKINSMLFVQYCEREKIAVSEADVTAAVAQMKSSVGQNVSDADLETALRGQGVFLDPRSYSRQQLLMRNYLQQKRAADLKAIQQPGADEILKSYELAKSQLIRPDTVRTSVLYVDLRSLSGEQKTKAAEAFRQAVARLKSDPGKFDELMLRASEPNAAYKATASVYVEKTPSFLQLYGQLFLDTVFKMKPGELSGVIENEAGLQVVRLNEFLPQKQLGLADPVPGQANGATIQDWLVYQIVQQRQAELLERIQSELVAQLRKEATVKIIEENLKF